MAQISINQLARAAFFAEHALGAAARVAQANIVETRVYIGLNDAVTKEQRFDTWRYVSVLKRVCVNYGVPFSFNIIEGGYIHDDGEYTEERTIELTFVDVAQEIIDEIAEDLRTFFHQESVLITTGRLQARTIRGDDVSASIAETAAN